MKIRYLLSGVLAAMGLLVTAALAGAAVSGQSGPYKVDLTTEPAVIPVSKAVVKLHVTSGGQPVDGAQVRVLVQMPSMAMGESEQTAVPVAGQPGGYSVPAQFAMAGGYNATVKITGAPGTATVVIPLQTGQDTGGAAASGPSALSYWPWAVAVLAVIFVLWRMRATGQEFHTRSLNRQTLGGLLLLAVMAAGAVYAVGHWRRPGAMTPIEAQAMEMNTPAPPGTTAVVLAPVTRGPIAATVRYTGQAAGYNEQDVSARAQGWLTWMPFYVGNRVKAGQLIGRLDTSQQQPVVAQQQAAAAMASQGVGVAQSDYQQALAGVNQARAEVAGKRDALAGAQADVAAAREDRSNAEADLAATQTQVGNAQAALQAAQADQRYWQQEITRERSLLKAGAVSQEEYQRELSQAASADSKVRQAETGVAQAQAQVRAAEARVRKADAIIASSQKKAQQMSSEILATQAAVRTAQAAAASSRQRINQAVAAAGQARATLTGATTERGYTEVRAIADGVITQRLVSPGTLVNPGQAIVRVAQTSPLRLQANVAEADLTRVKVGARVTVTAPGVGGAPVQARVTSVTPTVDPVARTGVVEAVVPNRDGRLAPGQSIAMDVTVGGNRSVLRVPSAAVQTRAAVGVGVQPGAPASFVWVAQPVQGQAGQFTVKQTEVKAGASDGAMIEIASGLTEGQQVVVEGAGYLKDGDTVAASNAPAGGMAADEAVPSTATVEITEKGFVPDTVTLAAGKPAKLTFVRKTDQTCATEVSLPDYGVNGKPLPLNKPVVVEFTPKKGEFGFACGMNMLKGKVVAQ